MRLTDRTRLKPGGDVLSALDPPADVPVLLAADAAVDHRRFPVRYDTATIGAMAAQELLRAG